MNDYTTAATVFANSPDNRMLGFVSLDDSKENYLVYSTNQEDAYANPFDEEKLQILARTPNFLDAIDILHDFMVETYAIPFSMRIRVDVWWDGCQCTLYEREYNAQGKMTDGYFSKYGHKYYHNGGFLSASDLYYPCVLKKKGEVL